MVIKHRVMPLLWVALLSGCGGAPRAEEPLLGGVRAVPWMTITGAPLVQVTAAGAPLNFSGPYTRLVAPVAVAARGNDVLIADPGLGRVVRMDLGLNVMNVLQGAVARPDTKLYLSPDGVAYVTDSARREVTRYGRNGQLLQRLRSDDLLSKPVGVAVDERSGRVWVGDGLIHQLVMFHPAGRAVIAVPMRGGNDGPQSVAALTAGSNGLYVVDALCPCVFRLAENGSVLATIGRGTLRQPAAVATDRHGRVYVLDRFVNRIMVFVGEQIVGYLEAPAGMPMESIFVDGSMMYIASSLGSRVDVLRLLDAPARVQQ